MTVSLLMSVAESFSFSFTFWVICMSGVPTASKDEVNDWKHVLVARSLWHRLEACEKATCFCPLISRWGAFNERNDKKRMSRAMGYCETGRTVGCLRLVEHFHGYFGNLQSAGIMLKRKNETGHRIRLKLWRHLYVSSVSCNIQQISLFVEL